MLVAPGVYTEIPVFIQTCIHDLALLATPHVVTPILPIYWVKEKMSGGFMLRVCLLPANVDHFSSGPFGFGKLLLVAAWILIWWICSFLYNSRILICYLIIANINSPKLNPRYSLIKIQCNQNFMKWTITFQVGEKHFSKTVICLLSEIPINWILIKWIRLYVLNFWEYLCITNEL